MQTKTFEKINDYESKEIMQARRLQRWEQRLWLLIGAAGMFVLIGLIDPEIMEVDPLPFIWILLIFASLATGIYILVWPSWRGLPLNKRLNYGFRALGITLFTWNFLPLYLLLRSNGEDALPLLLLNSLLAFGLYSLHKRLQKSHQKQEDDDFFI